MNNLDQKIPCPVCNTPIPFRTQQLLMGIQFVCPQCNASVGLATESKPVVQHAMERLEHLRMSTKS